MKHTPRSRDLAKAAVSLGTGTATIAAFAATGALAGSMVTPANAATATSSETTPSVPLPSDATSADQLAADQALADKLATQIQTRKTELRKLNRLITRAKKAARRLHVNTRTVTSGSTSTSTSTTTKTTTKSSPAPTSGS